MERKQQLINASRAFREYERMGVLLAAFSTLLQVISMRSTWAFKQKVKKFSRICRVQQIKPLRNLLLII